MFCQCDGCQLYICDFQYYQLDGVEVDVDVQVWIVVQDCGWKWCECYCEQEEQVCLDKFYVGLIEYFEQFVMVDLEVFDDQEV